MTEENFGTISTNESRLWQIIGEATAGQYERYSEVYVKATEDYLLTIANTPAEKFTTYCTFVGGYSVHGAEELEGVLKIDDLTDYFSFVAGSGDTHITFHGDSDSRLPSHFTIEGELEATVYTEATEADLESNFALGVADRFGNGTQFKLGDGDTMDVSVTADADVFGKIANASSGDLLNVDMSPFVVEDGDLLLEASDSRNRNKVSGVLVEDVAESDFTNYYDEPFEEVFGHFSGEVTVETEDGLPLSVVKEDGEDVYRHVIAPAGE